MTKEIPSHLTRAEDGRLFYKDGSESMTMVVVNKETLGINRAIDVMDDDIEIEMDTDVIKLAHLWMDSAVPRGTYQQRRELATAITNAINKYLNDNNIQIGE